MSDSNFIFFVATKKTKQKKAFRCAGHFLHVRAETSMQLVPAIKNLHVLAGSEALEVLSLIGTSNTLLIFTCPLIKAIP